MCWSTQQALDLALEFGLPWYDEPKLTMQALETHIPGGFLDLSPEDYNQSNRELVMFWYIYIKEVKM